ITNSNIRSRSTLIETTVDNAHLTVRNSSGYGLNPDLAGKVPGRFLDAENFSSIDVENNYLEGTSGIYLLNYRGNLAAGDTVKILRNLVHNIDGRESDGNGGFLTQSKIRQFLQTDKVQNVPGMEIAWNQVINDPGNSRVEDNINIHLSGGTAASP